MIYLRVKEVLKEQKRTKYWFVKNMEGGYQALSRIMDNQTIGIHFETLEKMCDILDCEPGELIVRKKKVSKK